MGARTGHAKKVVLVGGGGNAVALADLLDEQPFDVVGFLDSNVEAEPVFGIARIGCDDDATCLYEEGVRTAVISIAVPCALRERLVARYRALGFAIPTLVSSHAFVSARAALGEGAMVFPHAVVGAGSTVGTFAIVNAGAAATHDIRIGACAHIAPNATLLGAVSVGDRTLVGGGSVVLPGVSVGADAIVGAGSVVLSDIDAGCIVAGNPARTIR